MNGVVTGVLNLVISGACAVAGLALAVDHWRPVEARIAQAVAVNGDRDIWPVRRLRRLNERGPRRRRRFGWVLFWVSLPGVAMGVIQLAGAV